MSKADTVSKVDSQNENVLVSTFDGHGGQDVANPFKDLEYRRTLEKKLLRKLDLRMSMLTVIYILNYIDRSNVGAARLRGFERDLHLKGQEFATVLSIVFAGYTLMQVPSNIFLNSIGRPSLYIPGCMIVWGLISFLTGFVQNFAGAVVARFFLGFVEAAFFPGALFLLSKWYKRDELGLRTAILYWGGLLSNAFGALLASGILSTMDGKLGHAAWRWLFFIEGALTIFFAILAMFILPDFPSNSKWLTAEERALAILRMEEDAGVGDDQETEGSKSGLKLAVTDGKVWWLALILTSEVVALSFNFYFPTLTATLGYNTTVSLLLCAPPFLFAVLVSALLSYHSDKVGDRCFHIIFSFGLGIVGFIIAAATLNTAARYVALFLMAQSYAGFIILFAWMCSICSRPPSKRAVVVALTNSFSQFASIAGSYIWPSRWGPSYRYSFAICVAASGLAIAMCFTLRQYLAGENKRTQARTQEHEVREDSTQCNNKIALYQL